MKFDKKTLHVMRKSIETIQEVCTRNKTTSARSYIFEKTVKMDTALGKLEFLCRYCDKQGTKWCKHYFSINHTVGGIDGTTVHG